MIVPKPAAATLALIAGLAIVLQNGVNTNLNREGIPSPFATAGMSYTVGFVAISIISSILDRPPPCCFYCHVSTFEQEISIWNAPWYAYCGGPLGAVYVTAAILLARQLGFATFQLAVTFGQLMSSMICDAVGFLHLTKVHTTPWRIACLLLLALGTALSSSIDLSTNTLRTTDNTSIGENTAMTISGSNISLWLLYFLGAMLAGCVFPVQSCVNFEMTRHVGTPFRAVVINFATGAMSVWLLTAISYILQSKPWESFFFYTVPPNIPLWMWIGGGVLGATLITCAVIGLPNLGAVAFTGIFISTQLVVATLFDTVGAFGFAVVPITTKRVCGVLLAVLAAAAFQNHPPARLSLLSKWPSSTMRFSAAQEEQQPLVGSSEEYTVTC